MGRFGGCSGCCGGCSGCGGCNDCCSCSSKGSCGATGTTGGTGATGATGTAAGGGLLKFGGATASDSSGTVRYMADDPVTTSMSATNQRYPLGAARTFTRLTAFLPAGVLTGADTLTVDLIRRLAGTGAEVVVLTVAFTSADANTPKTVAGSAVYAALDTFDVRTTTTASNSKQVTATVE